MQLDLYIYFLQIYLANLSGKPDVEKNIVFENYFFSLIINGTIGNHWVHLSHQTGGMQNSLLCILARCILVPSGI